MAILKKRMLASVIAAVFVQVTSVYAMDNDRGAEQEEDQKYAAEEGCAAVSDKVAAARKRRSQLSDEEKSELDAELRSATQGMGLKIVQKLLEDGADPNCSIGLVQCDRLSFAARGGTPKMVSLLLEYNANVNSTDFRGLTPLLNAIWDGFERHKWEISKILINARANIHQPSALEPESTPRRPRRLDGFMPSRFEHPRGTTSLMLACHGDYTGIAHMLLEAGACVHAKTKDERTVFDFVKPGSELEQTVKELAQAEGLFTTLIEEDDVLLQHVLDFNTVGLVADYIAIHGLDERFARNKARMLARRIVRQVLPERRVVDVVDEYAELPAVRVKKLEQEVESGAEVAAAESSAAQEENK